MACGSCITLSAQEEQDIVVLFNLLETAVIQFATVPTAASLQALIDVLVLMRQLFYNNFKLSEPYTWYVVFLLDVCVSLLTGGALQARIINPFQTLYSALSVYMDLFIFSFPNNQISVFDNIAACVGITSSESRNLYTAQTSTSQLGVVNLFNNLIEGTVLTMTTPTGIAINQTTNILYVVYNTSVDIINLVTNTVIKNVPFGGSSGGQQVAVDPITNFAYITLTSPASIIVLNSSYNITATITTGISGSPRGIAIDPNSNYLYVTNNTSPGNIFVIDRTSNSVVNTLPIAPDTYPYDIAVQPVDALNSYIYVTTQYSNPGKVVVIQRSGGNAFSVLAGRITVGTYPQGITYNATAKELYVANYSSNTVSVITAITPIQPIPGVITTLTVPNTDTYPTDVAVDERTQIIYSMSYYGNLTMFKSNYPITPRTFTLAGSIKTGGSGYGNLAIKLST